MEDSPTELAELQIAELLLEADDGFAEAERRDVELDENPSLGLTLGEFDSKIVQRVFFSKKIE
jgi:hypothetical protein